VPELGNCYVAEYFWAHTPVPTTAPFRPPQLTRPPAAWRPSGWNDAPFVLLNPTSGWRQKTWTAEGWAAVLRTLHEAGSPRVLMTSASTDWQVAHCREIETQAGAQVSSLANGTSLENFLWLCAHADMVLTVDGAASHLAAAFGRRSLTLFGPTNMANWHHPTPLNRALSAPKDKDGKRRLRKLPPQEVCHAARDLWTRPDSSDASVS